MKKPLAALLIALQAGAARAADDSFQFFEEEAQVVSASRRPQALYESPVTIDVIGGDEIRASGAAGLADLLRFRVGMDVIDTRTVLGNTTIISVRGIPQEFSHHLQVLIDGRSAYSAVNGGVFWSQLPVQLQDIERIEIVRGPNAALYGSNAGQGVINVITRSPQAGPASGRVKGEAGSRRAMRGELGLEAGKGAFAYRLSHSYEATSGLKATSASRSDGSVLSNKANLRGVWKPRPGLTLDAWTGGSSSHQNLPLGFRSNVETHFQAARLASDPAEVSSWELQASRSESGIIYGPDFHGQTRVREVQYDGEGLHRLSLLDGRLLHIAGASYRSNDAHSDQYFAGAPDVRNHIWREFIHETVKLVDGLVLSGGASLEQSPMNGSQHNYQATLQASPSSRHDIRFTHARSVTNMAFFIHKGRYTVTPGVMIEGDRDHRPGHQHSYELGYRGRYWGGALDVETNLFYMKLDDIDREYVKTFVPFPFQTTISYDNRNSALARGLETQLKYRLGPTRSLFANYTYETVRDAAGDVSVTKATPLHKVNLGAMGALGRGFGFYAAAGYKDHYTSKSSAELVPRDIPAYWRLDARLTYAATRDVELFLGGRNLAVATHREFADTLETPRTFYGGVAIQFGGKP